MKPYVRRGRVDPLKWWVHDEFEAVWFPTWTRALCYAQALGAGCSHEEAEVKLFSRVMVGAA